MDGEQELVHELEEAEKEWYHCKRRMAELKAEMTEAETKLIEAKLHRDRTKEKLRVYRATTPKYESTKRDESIEQFREKYPEVVQWAKDRDMKREWCPECGGVNLHRFGCSEPVSFKSLLEDEEENHDGG